MCWRAMFSEDLPPAEREERVELRSILLQHRPDPASRTCNGCGQQLDENARCSTAADAYIQLLQLLQGSQ